LHLIAIREKSAPKNSVYFSGFSFFFMVDIRLIEVKSEIGAGTRGASLGIDSLKIAALDFGSKFFLKHSGIAVPVRNDLLYEPVRHPYARYIDGVFEVVSNVCNAVRSTLEEKKFPLVLAGDHSTSAGTISGIKTAFPDLRLGVIWIDAHADMHSPYTTPSGNMHGMPLAMCLGEDNMDMKVNDPDAETIEYWEKLKNLGGICPKIKYQDLVLVAVRDTEPQEVHLMKKHNIKLFTVSEIRRKGVEKVAIDCLTALEQCDILYVSFDVDSMDSSITKGTGTPVPHGVTEKEAGKLLSNILQNRKVFGFEMVEVNPTLDKENLMSENAFEILLRSTSQLTNSL